jgi:hypothetical protein
MCAARTCTHAHTNTHVLACTQTNMHAQALAVFHVHGHTYKQTNTHVSMCLCVCVFMCMHALCVRVPLRVCFAAHGRRARGKSPPRCVKARPPLCAAASPPAPSANGRRIRRAHARARAAHNARVPACARSVGLPRAEFRRESDVPIGADVFCFPPTFFSLGFFFTPGFAGRGGSGDPGESIAQPGAASSVASSHARASSAVC